MLTAVDDYDFKASLHYQDHPIAASVNDHIYINTGTRDQCYEAFYVRNKLEPF
jgi:hypothetical protein